MQYLYVVLFLEVITRLGKCQSEQKLADSQWFCFADVMYHIQLAVIKSVIDLLGELAVDEKRFFFLFFFLLFTSNNAALRAVSIAPAFPLLSLLLPPTRVTMIRVSTSFGSSRFPNDGSLSVSFFFRTFFRVPHGEGDNLSGRNFFSFLQKSGFGRGTVNRFMLR